MLRNSGYLFAAAVLFLAACASNGPAANVEGGKQVTFIHLNDTYRVDAVEEGRRGGFGRVATLVKELKAAGRDVRVLHGGDFLFPSLESQLWEGEQMIEAMNFLDDLAPMYVVPGNHEFDSRSAETIVNRVRQSRFEWIADNLRLETGEPDVDSRMKNAFAFSAGNLKFGVFALTVLPEHGGNVRDYTPFEGDYVGTAARVIEQLESQDVDLIFGLTHLHLFSDLEVAKLKKDHPKFRFIVGGHEHEVHYEPGGADNAAILKGASNARSIWRVDVDMSAEGLEVLPTRIDVDTTIEGDRDYQLIADKWRNGLLELIPFLPSRIGEAALPLDGREVTVRGSDSNWGMFIADQMRSAFGDPPSDLALVNGGTLRIDDYIAEDITFEDIGRTFGFSSYLRYMTVKGSDFRRTLEAGYRGNGLGKGYFPQISGFRVCVDQRRPNGQRIVQMQVPTAEGGWEEIAAEKSYSAVVPDFLYRGGDGYDFSAATDVSRPGSELKFLVLDAVIRAQAANQKIGEETAAMGPRFSLLPPDSDLCYH